ncbi:hypothetical protein PtA15_12A72 [Puccinia triticina]|uniref:Uncharacterized protein n=1 Tax=Puccinia triticina TaxID=208348 RepID=A0ABY7D583_9BASI|nr:uncharacterized protein PtA15_12A72 [Puccinia triticina]WAQ90087.1 hypothetical protein PtA15_12A72 [Puccinia triticina]
MDYDLSDFSPTRTDPRTCPSEKHRPNDERVIEQPPELPQLFKAWIPSPEARCRHSALLAPEPSPARRRRWSAFVSNNPSAPLPLPRTPPARPAADFRRRLSRTIPGPAPPRNPLASRASRSPARRASHAPSPPSPPRFSFSLPSSTDESGWTQAKKHHSLRSRLSSLLHLFAKDPPPHTPAARPRPSSVFLAPPPSHPRPSSLAPPSLGPHYRPTSATTPAAPNPRIAEEDDDEEDAAVRDANRRRALADLERGQVRDSGGAQRIRQTAGRVRGRPATLSPLLLPPNPQLMVALGR